jgi:ribosomal protein L7/L12
MSTILNIIARYARDLTIGDALDMASEIERATAPVTDDAPVISERTLVTWLRGHALDVGTEYISNHKIATIKAVRSAFMVNGRNIGLRQAKDAVDVFLAEYRYPF